MKWPRLVGSALAVFAVLPIWFYLLYKILVAVQATDLMWFMYFAYLPCNIIVTVISKITHE